ncbi:hypothetical protein B9X97_19060, partial [Acinetobacter pittii]|uniref:ATP-binding protein n=1 Tax=Acinetobacter pittii TaxID=48296 RepID=UPI000B62737D
LKSYCHTAGNLNRIKKLVWDSADAYQDPTIADAILDRIIHNSYTLEIDGDSMRKTVMLDTTTTL